MLDFVQHLTALDMWNIRHYRSGGYYLSFIKAGFVWPAQTEDRRGDRQLPRSGGLGGLGCPRACPQHTMKISSQWPPCPSAVGRVWKSLMPKPLSSRCPEVCTSLLSQTEATNRSWKASQIKLIYAMLVLWRTSCGLLISSWETSHNEACVYSQKRKGKTLMQTCGTG